MASQSGSNVLLGKSGYAWAVYLEITSTIDWLSHTSVSNGCWGVFANALSMKQVTELIPKASARKEVIGYPNTLPQFFNMRWPQGLLIIHPQVPSPLTEPSLAAKYGAELAFHSSKRVDNGVVLNSVTFSRRKNSVQVEAC